MRQHYEVWDIVPGRKIDALVDGVIDDWEGFRVLLRVRETNEVVRISFDNHVAYQNRDESDLVGEAARSDGLRRGCFYIVQDSEFACRFTTDTARQFKSIKHYAIVTDADCIDVLATNEPTVDFL
jgi:hypothetical protein